MKAKKIVAAALLAALAIGASGCASPGQGDGDGDLQTTAFPISSYDETLAVTMGDVMPFYDDGVMNIYMSIGQTVLFPQNSCNTPNNSPRYRSLNSLYHLPRDRSSP